jgi:hypothetical protein
VNFCSSFFILTCKPPIVRKLQWLFVCLITGAAPALVAQEIFGLNLRTLLFPDSSGQYATTTANQSFDPSNPFFQNLGTNGRSCGTCHQPSDGWSVTPARIKLRFLLSAGRDPLFRTNDGSNCPGADVSNLQKAKSAFSLLLSKGLIRIERQIPLDAEFTVLSVDDPNHCAATSGSVSVYRRVLPATNLRFLSSVMWDERETFAGQTLQQNCCTRHLTQLLDTLRLLLHRPTGS